MQEKRNKEAKKEVTENKIMQYFNNINNYMNKNLNQGPENFTLMQKFK